MNSLQERLAKLSREQLTLVIQRLQRELDIQQQQAQEPIAVVGMSCRFPGARSVDEYWELLVEGRNAIVEVPDERWNAQLLFSPDPDAPGKITSKWGGFLDYESVAGFDPALFGISGKEAAAMDPQQRLLLELCWEALEDSGISPVGISGSQVGVFVGISGADYGRLSAGQLDDITPLTATGVAHSVAAGRISYVFGLKGPCIALDTACSSALAALHYACMSLRLRECDAALVGGVNSILHPGPTVAFSRMRALSSRGQCMPFDAKADGYVRSDGGGVLVLQRLSDAIENRHTVSAVVRGSSVNQDGASAGLTAPSGPSQQAVILNALKRAQVGPADVGYVECHGSGTPLGDPIEVQALAAALGKGRSSKNPVLIGGVKANIGHTEAAAGMAGIIKTALALKHRLIPPQINFSEPNPNIPWDKLPVRVAAEGLDWEPIKNRRIAGVSSFGFSGTNVHVILEEGPTCPSSTDTQLKEQAIPHLFTLSAATPAAIRALAGAMRDRLKNSVEAIDLRSLCYTANLSRSQLLYRKAFVFTQMSQLLDGLEKVNTAEVFAAERELAVGFWYPNSLSDASTLIAAFRSAGGVFGQVYESVSKAYYSVFNKAVEDTGLEIAQCINTVVGQLLLSGLWRELSVEPRIISGSGWGLIAAVCGAGVLSLEDSLRLCSLLMPEETSDSSPGFHNLELRPCMFSLYDARAKKTISFANHDDFRQWVAVSLKDASATLDEEPAQTGVKKWLDFGGAAWGTNLGHLDISNCEGPSIVWHTLTQLVSFYEQGLNVDWSPLYIKQDVRRLSLPTYPFERMQLWYDKYSIKEEENAVLRYIEEGRAPELETYLNKIEAMSDDEVQCLLRSEGNSAARRD